MGKAKTKTRVTKKSAKKSSGTKEKKTATLEEVRNKIRAIISAHASKLTQAVVKKGEEGLLPQVKFLFELLNFERTSQEEEKPEEDSLAMVLLKYLGLPTEPVKDDEDDGAQVKFDLGRQSGQSGTKANKAAASAEGENGKQQREPSPEETVLP